jgi:branched-chain amino acid aminotransferase
LLVNGTLLSEDEISSPAISVLDRGLLYGDGIFETMRAFDGVVFAIDEHLDRLERSAIVFRMSMPARELLRSEIERAVSHRRDAIGSGEIAVRLFITRGVAALGMSIPTSPKLTRIVIAERVRELPAATYANGVACVSVRASSLPVGPLRGVKSTSYAGHVIANEIAREEGAHEALLVTDRGTIIEGASSSLLAFDGAEFWAPAHRDALPSITRRHVVRAIEASGARVRSTRMKLSTLFDMREVMLCSTLREVLAVNAIDGRRIGEGEAGPKALCLRRGYREGLPCPARRSLEGETRKYSRMSDVQGKPITFRRVTRQPEGTRT